jgi:hypothetical protein
MFTWICYQSYKAPGQYTTTCSDQDITVFQLSGSHLSVVSCDIIGRSTCHQNKPLFMNNPEIIPSTPLKNIFVFLIFQISLNIGIFHEYFSFFFFLIPMIIKSKTLLSKSRFRQFLFLNCYQIILYPTMSFASTWFIFQKTLKILLSHILPIIFPFELSQTILLPLFSISHKQ